MRFQSTVALLFATLLAGCAGSGSGQPELSSSVRLHLAKVAEAQGNPDEALAILANAASRWPADDTVQITYARALLRSGKVLAARDALLRASARRPRDRTLTREVGVIDIDADDGSLGVAVFDRLLASDAHDWKTMVDKGIALDLARHHDAAQQLYCRALRLSPGAPGIATDYAMSLMLQGRMTAARDVLDPYFVRYDVPARTRADLAVLYQATGQSNRVDQLVTDTGQRQQVVTIANRLSSTAQPGPSVPCPAHG